MHLVVAGASGGTGTTFVERALAAGHEVTALARDPQRVSSRHDGLRVVRADVLSEDGLEKFPDGADAVVSALGLKAGFVVEDPGEGPLLLAHAGDQAGEVTSPSARRRRAAFDLRYHEVLRMAGYLVEPDATGEGDGWQVWPASAG